MKVLWALPVMVVLVLVLLPVNDGLYELLVNYDPQGDGQHWERRYYQEVMRRTSGMLAGHLLAFGVGVTLAGTERTERTELLAVAAGTVLGTVALVTAR
ncbi:hypothetical protein [Actinoplanes derwentensis]|uniref:Uncharacterized protein n=1 Tax=Actinoplanes derwentensis TaxID=113562 RepID=A0A1H2AET0_9ACTN|nr:hypothetical protein [Actinoplanes derwentensis]SDT44505.1 hypothetical protein SAMN04489716_3823 [Actinoplanes derwentensis]